jgi:hypothetical protein
MQTRVETKIFVFAFSRKFSRKFIFVFAKIFKRKYTKITKTFAKNIRDFREYPQGRGERGSKYLNKINYIYSLLAHENKRHLSIKKSLLADPVRSGPFRSYPDD